MAQASVCDIDTLRAAFPAVVTALRRALSDSESYVYLAGAAAAGEAAARLPEEVGEGVE